MSRFLQIGCLVVLVVTLTWVGHNLLPPTPSVPPRVLQILDREAQSMAVTERRDVAAVVGQLADRYAIDPLLIVAIMRVESRFQPRVRSYAGAIGLMQVRPIVVRAVANELAINPARHALLLNDPVWNVRIGVHYFAGLLQRFGGHVPTALLAYNRGPTAVARTYRGRKAPRIGYALKVLDGYQRDSARYD